jgi:hypothetical protein
LIADDELGLTPSEIGNTVKDCLGHKITLAELAVDFGLDAGVDEEFVLKHGRFGKSRLTRGRAGQFRFGSRVSPKMVRFYRKQSTRSFRVEVEAHAAFLRKYSVSKVSDLGTLALHLGTSHIKFCRLRWEKVQAYLANKFGEDADRIAEQARDRAAASLAKALRYLARNGVTNPHRFLGSLKINGIVRDALRDWAEGFTLD